MTDEARQSDRVSRVSTSLTNAHVFITGVTGFVGQAVLEKLLSAYPTTRISVLVRPRGVITAQQRVDKLVRKPCFDPWRKRVGEQEALRALQERVTVIEGDLGDVPPLPNDIDVVVHSASTVSFDPPIDEAFAANVDGPVSLYEALAASGSDPHVVHVSTCYVAGLRKGVAEERSLDHTVDWRVETAKALAARGQMEADSRRAEVLRPMLKQARVTHRRAGSQAVAEAAEELREQWVGQRLEQAGRVRAQTLGWPDVYTFTKALGERVAEDLWGQSHQLSIVRPTIIESSTRHPFPGWIDGFKVADPLIAAYGRGMLPEFPALADTILDVIPVDHVVNAILAVAARPPQVGSPRYYQVASGIRNPLRFGQLLRIVRGYFSAHPLRDDEGSFIQVPNWSFPHGPRVERSLRRREIGVDMADKAVGYLPSSPTTRTWLSTIAKAKRDLATLRKFTDLYQPYTQTEVVFDDANTRAVHLSLPEDQRETHGFDITTIDWEHYLARVHIPNVPGLTRARRRSGRSGEQTQAKLPHRGDVLAVFDMHGTVAAANLLEHYVWVAMATGKGRALGELASLVAKSPTYLQAELRDRGDFIRTFMRRYEGVNEQDLREIIATKIAPRLRARLLKEAVERITQHRAAGHRTVLITGQIDVFVEPLSGLFDDIVAGKMEVNPQGLWTGHLATSPLVDEARATWLKRYAREHDLDLEGSYAYGDTYADRPWLEVVGNPAVVNPDSQLFRYASAKRWPVYSWTTTADGTAASLLNSLRKGEQL